MPKYRITSPEGKTFEVTAPDGATQDQVLAYAQSQWSPKTDKIEEGAKNFAQEGPQFLPGVGKAFADLGRGASQLVRSLGPQYNASADFFGLPNQADVNESRRLDAPLMKTRAGMAGNVVGNVAAAVPTVGLGGGYIPAAASGAILGLLQPTAGDESRLANTAIGATTAVGATAIGRGIQGLYQGGKALVEPFTEAGRARIAGRVLTRFADDPSRIANTGSAPTITGARPTLAEQTGDVGLARLQDSLRAADPQFNNQITTRLAENNAARVSVLENLAGRGGARDFAIANRDATADQLYEAARRVGVDPAKLTPEALQNIADFSRRVPDAVLAKAKELAKIKGVEMTDATSVEGMHWVKKAIDGMIGTADRSGDSTMKAALVGLQKDLLSGLDKMSPEYAAARKVFADMSRPINQMDVAETIAKAGLSKGSDLQTGSKIINRNALLGAMQDEAGLVRRATGGDFGKSLADIMEPDQLNMLRAIASEADRAGAVATAGNGPGSATAQRMAAQNVLRQVMGPTGLPQSWAENALANTIIGKPLNLVYGGVAEPRIQQALAQAILDPDAARAVLQAARNQQVKLPPSTINQLAAVAARSTPTALAVGGQR